MSFHSLFTLLILIKCVICAKTKYNIKLSRTYLKFLGWEKNIKTTQIKPLYINRINLLGRKSNNLCNNFKHNLFINKHYLKDCFIRNSYKNVSIIKIRRFNKLWAKKKGVGSTKNGRDSNPKNLGVKVLGNNFAHAGNIIVRQRGRTFKPGYGVKQGRDYTLTAIKSGKVHFFNRVVSIIDVSNPKPMTFRDVYREDPTIISLSKMWTSV
ncbi:apicoplast ribosomal protein L27 precursor, putative [Plasmodium malariae]|uniref:Apicoplast ribosomal protein L27, putative n=1 Tax=Plasmodium malariae TaxID=5858 RepID=A0A1C3KEA0_PLAMA|nr:apicoplast ribosomal protein L27 precursor, putative [Plasmodium malariae]